MALPPRQPEIEPYDFTVLGANFPPGLNTATPATDIGVDESPDAYGFDLTEDGVIAKGTIPSADSRVLKSVTLSTVPYFWAYNRLWNITNRTASTGSTILTYGALNYEDIFHPQGLSKIYFDENSDNILAIQPFGADSMFVAKTSGSYVLSGISDTRAFWNKSDIIQAMQCGGSTGLVELDGVVYCAGNNTVLGLWAWDRGQVKEITRKVRDDLTNFGNVALTVDYQKKYIKGGTSYIYEVPTDKLFRWSSSSFRYTTRQFRRKNYEPFSVDGLWFVVKHTDTDAGWFKWQVKIEDRAWSTEELRPVPYANDNYTMHKLMMDNELSDSCRKFQFRMTDLSSNLHIKEIRIESDSFDQDDYSE